MPKQSAKSKGPKEHHYSAPLRAGPPTLDLRKKFKKGLKIPILDLKATAETLGCEPEDIVVSLEWIIRPEGALAGLYPAITIAHKLRA